eukprot:TRINITY_DN47438_c0_g1_i1.p1 TRINITY_DN47438_c0_g1~~TRINITY_DN47438_c0_g1_i1.p1  ORF type:complete len:739 (+),score=140.94 TRINITY_DN47438_c0_g1_i1:78-2219(+)
MAADRLGAAGRILAVLGVLWLGLWQLTFKKEKGKAAPVRDAAGAPPGQPHAAPGPVLAAAAPAGGAPSPAPRAQPAPQQGAGAQHPAMRWWWLEWHARHLRKAGRKVRAVAVGGRLGAADAAAWRAFFADPGVDIWAADADPDAGVVPLRGSCDKEQDVQGIADQLGEPRADIVVDLGSPADPSGQVAAFSHCFGPLLRPGGAWVAEQAAKAYGDPWIGRGAPLDANGSIIAVGRLAVDQINRRYWDHGVGENSIKTIVLFPGLQYVQTVLFAEDTVIFSRKGRWADSWEQTIYLLGTWCLLPPPTLTTRNVDSISGDHGQPPTWSYRAGGPSWGGQYWNPPCAANESSPADNATAECVEAAERVRAAAEAGQGMVEIPSLGSDYSEPRMDGMSKSDKLGGSHYERRDTRHGYDRWYQWFFDPLRDRKLRMLEVGLATGESSIMWSKYFKDAKLFGMDYVFEIPEDEPVRKDGVITLVLGDQGNPDHLRRMVKTLGELSMDIIADDGGHIGTAQVQTFKILFRDLLRPGGIFVIEDIEGSYLGRHVAYGNMLYGGLHKRGTLIEVSKLFVDTINRPHWSPSEHRCVLETGTDAMVESVFFAENYIAYTKKGRPKGSPQPPAVPIRRSQQPARIPPLAERSAVAMADKTWDGSWYIPRPQCGPTSSGPYSGWLPVAPNRRHTRGRPQCVDPMILQGHGKGGRGRKRGVMKNTRK